MEFGRRPASQRFALNEAEMTVAPRSDHAGVGCEDSALKDQREFFNTVVLVQRAGYEGGLL